MLDRLKRIARGAAVGIAVSLPQQAAAPTVTAQDKKVEKHPVQAPEVIREELDEQDRESIRRDMAALSGIYAHAMRWEDPRKDVPGRSALLGLPREKRQTIPHAYETEPAMTVCGLCHLERGAAVHTGSLDVPMPDGPPEPKIPGMVNARTRAKSHPQPQTTPEEFMASPERKAQIAEPKKEEPENG